MRIALLVLLVVLAPGCLGPEPAPPAPNSGSLVLDQPELSDPPPNRSEGAREDEEPAPHAIDPGSPPNPVPSTASVAADSLVPHVLVAVPDTGVNVYHRVFFRPDLTEHPCTYIRDFPCSVQRLDLTVGGDDWSTAFETDRQAWANLRPGEWYWIPRTVFVAVSCELPTGAVSTPEATVCILDEVDDHGTGTAGSVAMESPGALLAFKAGRSGTEAFFEKGLPIDVVSVSWADTVPLPLARLESLADSQRATPLYVIAAGNDPRSVVADYYAGHPGVISVGGAYTHGQGEEVLAGKQPDVVSSYCRPAPATRSIDAFEIRCGTSFATPTVAGALANVVLGLRLASGYDGGMIGGVVDALAGVHAVDVRNAMNRTASYAPRPQDADTAATSLPLNPAAPWLQWGWGFFNAEVAESTLAHLLGAPVPDKPVEARLYMETVYGMRTALYG